MALNPNNAIPFRKVAQDFDLIAGLQCQFGDVTCLAGCEGFERAFGDHVSLGDLVHDDEVQPVVSDPCFIPLVNGDILVERAGDLRGQRQIRTGAPHQDDIFALNRETIGILA